jgi:F420H(2)-dependent quinone reductase
MSRPVASASPKATVVRGVMRVMGSIHRGLYRLTRGKIGYNFRGGQVLLLTTIGRKTGKARTWPLLYFTDGDNLIVVGSNNGLDYDPAWCHNLRSNPQATVEIEGTKRQVLAAEAEGDEWVRLWQGVVARLPFYENYRKATARTIPIVILRPTQ